MLMGRGQERPACWPGPARIDVSNPGMFHSSTHLSIHVLSHAVPSVQPASCFFPPALLPSLPTSSLSIYFPTYSSIHLSIHPAFYQFKTVFCPFIYSPDILSFHLIHPAFHPSNAFCIFLSSLPPIYLPFISCILHPLLGYPFSNAIVPHLIGYHSVLSFPLHWGPGRITPSLENSFASGSGREARMCPGVGTADEVEWGCVGGGVLQG